MSSRSSAQGRIVLLPRFPLTSHTDRTSTGQHPHRSPLVSLLRSLSSTAGPRDGTGGNLDPDRAAGGSGNKNWESETRSEVNLSREETWGRGLANRGGEAMRGGRILHRMEGERRGIEGRSGRRRGWSTSSRAAAPTAQGTLRRGRVSGIEAARARRERGSGSLALSGRGKTGGKIIMVVRTEKIPAWRWRWEVRQKNTRRN